MLWLQLFAHLHIGTCNAFAQIEILSRRKSKNTHRTVLTEKYPPSPPAFRPGIQCCKQRINKDCVLLCSLTSVTYQGHITSALRLALATCIDLIPRPSVLLHEIRESAKVERDKPASSPPALMSSGTALGTLVWYTCVLACCGHLPSILIERNHEDWRSKCTWHGAQSC